jgi:hypothetical protein
MPEHLDTKVPPSRCPSCGELNEMALGITPETTPRPGSFSLCDCCGHIAVFADDLTVRNPTDEEMIAIAGNKQILIAQEFRTWKARMKKYRQLKIPGEYRIKPGPQLDRILESPEKGFFRLGYFIERFGFDHDEIRRELAAGRLVATVHRDGLKLLQRGKPCPADYFSISLANVFEWIHNPATPPHLIEHIIRATNQLQ